MTLHVNLMSTLNVEYATSSKKARVISSVLQNYYSHLNIDQEIIQNIKTQIQEY